VGKGLVPVSGKGAGDAEIGLITAGTIHPEEKDITYGRRRVEKGLIQGHPKTREQQQSKARLRK